MDSVPRQAPRAGLPAPAEAVEPTRQETSAEPGEDPYSSGLAAFPQLLGCLIALATLVLPLATVLASRQALPVPALGPAAAPAQGR